MEKKIYRVLWREISDAHFVTAPDQVLFESNNLSDCKQYKANYKKTHEGWYKLIIQIGQMELVWREIK